MRLHHVSIPANAAQFDAGRHFYGEILGLTELTVPQTLGPDRVLWFQAGDCELHLFAEDTSGTPPTGRHFCFAVEDLGSVESALVASNVATEATTPIYNRPRFFCNDPFGNRLELTQILGPYE